MGGNSPPSGGVGGGFAPGLGLPRLAAAEGALTFFSFCLCFYWPSSLLRRLAWPKSNKPERSESMPAVKNNKRKGITERLAPFFM